ncbi:hypothetical protein TELCIR_17655 [Teladorsagia circumcincta]|uniref:DEAD-box helicase OB fold domain-containing protein n=1 Tax=Teladorsagia circumcincta TaxID=45464 RepID=A0A2G9TS55_TELCI|nr:hypothetical protein TELCIR_17655 [Teladorsagia circumcincta]
MVQAAIVAGCYPGIGFVRAGNKLKKIRTSTEAAATLHPSSVIKRQVLAASKRSEVINQYVAEDSEDPVIEYLAFHELAKIDEGLTLRTVTVVPPCAVVLFAGSMRLKKSTIQNFDITDPDSGDEVDIDEEGPRDVVYPIEHWIGVRATYPDLLETLALVLKTDHQQMKFNTCVLPEQQFIFQQHQVPTSSSTSSYSSHNGQAAALRFSHREGTSSQPNMSALAEVPPKSNRRDNYDPRRFARNRDDWQRNRPYQPREGFRDKVERVQNFRDRERERNAREETGPGRRDYNYRQRQYTKYDDDREEPVPEDPRVDRTDEDGWGEVSWNAVFFY